MTLGQEFAAFGHTMLEDVDRLGEALSLMREINMGATAIGTGHQRAARATRSRCASTLREVTGLPLDHRAGPRRSDVGYRRLCAAVRRTQALRGEALQDLQRSAAAELRPARGFRRDQPPADAARVIDHAGKVNPVIPEVVNQVCFDIIGGDVTVTMAAEAGQLQLNVFEPIIAYRLLRSIDSNCAMRASSCARAASVGITANPDRMRRFVEHSIGIVTALLPELGYDDGHADRERSAGKRARRLRHRPEAEADEREAVR